MTSTVVFYKAGRRSPGHLPPTDCGSWNYRRWGTRVPNVPAEPRLGNGPATFERLQECYDPRRTRARPPRTLHHRLSWGHCGQRFRWGSRGPARPAEKVLSRTPKFKCNAFELTAFCLWCRSRSWLPTKSITLLTTYFFGRDNQWRVKT